MAKLDTNSSHQVLPNSNYKSPAVLAGELSDDHNATTPPSLTPHSVAAVYLRWASRSVAPLIESTDLVIHSPSRPFSKLWECTTREKFLK
ncbi:hypothetical protein CDAR_116821 [Caerostris darwini]|uniref:Uncharacterized protein n=1 Tax=Caerostris darwini TaxID=1538125 RepID=A0AAV4WA77_9ARAC|nr:hypothetical protein CDAR_116821 [Caerostris darwini]